MLRRDFAYDLPPDLIAQYPSQQRGESRLLAIDSHAGALSGREFKDLRFEQLPELLKPGDLLVLNDTRVVRARLFGQKTSGGKLEILLERLLNAGTALAQVRGGKSLRIGTTIEIEGGGTLEILGRDGEFFRLAVQGDEAFADLLDRAGHVPLPPYIRHGDTELDRDRYQTVYARVPGAVAAPTAGLHFTKQMLERVAQAGVETGYVTLHVGAGTFQPVRVEDLRDHVMHREQVEVSEHLCSQVSRTRARGGRVIAVGTTTVRSLEAAALGGELSPLLGETDLFIYPGFSFHVVDGLITNFHLPESTLLMLVCAFGGTQLVMRAYQHAVLRRYRFFSYGDAMFIERSVRGQA